MGFNYLVRIVIVAIAILGTLIPFNTAQASSTAYDAVNTSAEHYKLGYLDGQRPEIQGFRGTWYERGKKKNYRIVPGGLSVPSNGTVGAVGSYNPNDAHIVGSGGNSTILIHYDPLSQPKNITNYWMRYIIKPTTKESYFTTRTSSASFSLGGSADDYGIYSADLETVSGSPSALKVNENNLIVLNIAANRSPDEPETLKIWLNPSNYSDIQAGINANQVAVGNILDRNDRFVAGILDLASSNTEVDEFLVGSSLSDVLFPAS